MPEAEREQLVAALSTDYQMAMLTPANRMMLDYAIKVTHAPWEVTAADIDALRGQGFDDRGIHDICAIAAYFAFVNRIADGLGVQLE